MVRVLDEGGGASVKVNANQLQAQQRTFRVSQVLRRPDAYVPANLVLLSIPVLIPQPN